jgi:outer membrane protein assembly factor BamB
MALDRINQRVIKILSLSLVFFVLSACSSKKVNEPKELDDQFKDAISLERVWKKDVGSGDQELKLQFTPVIRDGKVYSVDVEGYLSAIDQVSGKELWSHNLDEKVSGGVAIDRYSFYVSTFSGFLISLDIDSGKENWRAPLTSEVIATPAVNGEQVIAQSIDGKLSAFDAKTGKQLWRYDSVAPILSLRGTAKPLSSRKYTLTSFANGELVMIDNENGRPLWKTELALPKGRTELERLVDSDGQPILDGDTLYASAYQGKVFALSAIDGKEIWSKEISSFNKLAMGFGKIFVTTDKGEIIALDKQSGQILWKNESFLYRRLSAPVVFDQFVLSSDFEGYIHVLSVLDGEVLARKYPDCEGVMEDILVKGDRFYAYARSGEIVSYQLNPKEKEAIALGSKFKMKRQLEETSFEHRD